MIKDTVLKTVQEALVKGAADLNLLTEGGLPEELLSAIRVERPRSREHGDYAVNVSYLAKQSKMPPPKIAEIVSQAVESDLLEAHPVAGFVNFKAKPAYLAQSLAHLIQTPALGLNQSLHGLSVLLEYVSANPTGPLHVGHGRWAALGNSIQRILEHCGAQVSPEFYVNDAGVQMHNIANTLWYRALEVLNTGVKLPEAQEGQPYPFYPGEYVIDLAHAYLEQQGRREKLLTEWDSSSHEPHPMAIVDMMAFARENLLNQQKELLARFGVPFDVWFSEQHLHANGSLERALETLKNRGYTYEQEGALWFKSSAFGDEKDRVLIKADGNYTYLTADIAYHQEKYRRQNDNGQPAFNRFINIWGADHHGYIARLRASIEALGQDASQFEVLLGQLVNLIVDGEKTRMGKRRKMLTLEDVIEEVGVDATRFWMVSKSADTTLDFDVALAASATDANPVFYVQYAHARCCSILRNATQENVNTETGETVSPFVTEQALAHFENALSAEQLNPLFSSLTDEKAQETLRALLLRLDSFTEVIEGSAQQRAPHLLARYALDLSTDFHSFYNVCRILTPDAALTQVRLMLIVAIKRTLAQALTLLGVTAPERM